MERDPHGDLTMVLKEVRAGSEEAKGRLVRAVYGELHKMAVGFMREERPDHTLQPTALVHEAIIRLFDGDVLGKAPNRRYVFGAAAQAMREILVDHARRRRAGKRIGGRHRLPLDEVLNVFEEQRLDVVALHEAIDRLSQRHERQGQVVTLRFFGGLSVAEVGELLEVSVATVESDWRIARAWLRGQLGETLV
jgi:RNA polymerase sigma factor (TIGR02999 family)